MGAPKKQPTVLWGTRTLSAGGIAGLVRCCTGLGLAGSLELFLLPFCASVLVSVVQGVLQPHPRVLGSSQWRLVHEQWLLL